MSRRRKKKGRRGSRSGGGDQPKRPAVPLSDAMARKIEGWAEEAAEVYGLYVWELEVSAQPRWRIRLFVDEPGEIGPGHGVTVDDCAEVSRYIEALLDAEDGVPENYIIEVSSPGIERVINRPEQLERVVGQTVQLHPQDPQPGVPNPIVGVLREVEGSGEDSVLVVDLAEGRGEHRAPWSNMGKARLRHDFDES